MKRSPCFLALLLLPMAIQAQVVKAVPDSATLQRPFGQWDEQQFTQPDRQFYPETWFHFINSNIERRGITRDLEAIAQAGITGISLFHGQMGGERWPGQMEDVKCLTPEWEELVQLTAAEAHRLGLRFSMQTCPGWAMSGGPWIKPKQAMRQVFHTRTEVQGGQTVVVKLPQSHTGHDRNYQDISVLAFPKPLGDTNDCMRVEDVQADVNPEHWRQLLNAETTADLWLEPATHDRPHTVELTLPQEDTPRTLEMSGIESLNHDWCVDPKLRIRMVAITPQGEHEVLDAFMPRGNWQDDSHSTSFALNEQRARTFRLEFSSPHPMRMTRVRLYTQARKNNYEGEASYTLRSINRVNERPQQSPECYVKQKGIIDLTHLLQPDGTLRWEAPAGSWTILRIGHVNNGRQNGPAPAEATGWEVNKLDPELVDYQFNSYIGKLTRGPLNGLIDNMLMDSWECYTQTWTQGMEQLFRDYHGYDLKPWLPALAGYVVDDPERTAEFLCDWRQLINHLFVHNFYGRMTENAHRLGITASYETAAGDIFPGDPMEYYKWADVPMTEFWQPFSNYLSNHNYKPIRPTASAARMYGKPRVSAEAFTSFDLNWDEHLSMLREVANQNLVEGVTHCVFHTYTHNPHADEHFPGSSFGNWIGTPFLRGQTWWPHMPAFTRYLARCTYMLERGKPVSAVLWYLGDEIQHKPDQYYPFPNGYVYDNCNTDALMNRLDVKGGKWVTPDGIAYDVMWIPEDCERLLPETLERIHQLVKKGGRLIAHVPSYPATLRDGSSERFDKAVQALFYGDSGRGEVIRDVSLEEGLQQMGIAPDVLPSEARWLHRRTDKADWYMVCPQQERSFTGELHFLCQGAVELWNPVTGKATPAPSRRENGRTVVPLHLEQGECVFVVFRHDKKQHKVKAPVRRTIPLVCQQWTVTFPQGWGITEPVHTSQLTAWKDMPLTDEGKAFSGTATYETTLCLSHKQRGARYALNLGRVEEIAVVSVNGEVADTLWTSPYEVDLTHLLREGENHVSIAVTSTWRNRLVFDASLPQEQRKTWVTCGPGAGDPLRQSGLLGPVSLIETKNQ